MPRYYFHVFDDTETRDGEGQSADNDSAAREIAIESARELVAAQVRDGYLGLDDYIVVADEKRPEIMTIRYREAFEIRARTG